MVKEVYEAKKNSPTDGDYCKWIEADASDINLQLTEKEIPQMKEKKYKSTVKQKVKEAAFKRLF